MSSCLILSPLFSCVTQTKVLSVLLIIAETSLLAFVSTDVFYSHAFWFSLCYHYSNLKHATVTAVCLNFKPYKLLTLYPFLLPTLFLMTQIASIRLYVSHSRLTLNLLCWDYRSRVCHCTWSRRAEVPTQALCELEEHCLNWATPRSPCCFSHCMSIELSV